MIGPLIGKGKGEEGRGGAREGAREGLSALSYLYLIVLVVVGGVGLSVRGFVWWKVGGWKGCGIGGGGLEWNAIVQDI